MRTVKEILEEIERHKKEYEKTLITNTSFDSGWEKGFQRGLEWVLGIKGEP